jgi:acetylornithine deacetylase/succinyl-diaminopimelate desuccinylase-like protein
MTSPLLYRRELLALAAAAAACAASTPEASAGGVAESDLQRIYREAERQKDDGVKRLQQWIRQPSIAAENRGMTEGCDLTMRLLKDAGFDKVEKIPTDGQPGIFATLDAGAPKTLAVYFMYDVKQADPAEWTSPPWDAALVEVPKLGKVVMGRGAVNQKGPEAAFLAALHAVRAAGKKLPVNLVLVAEGEEEIGSPHFAQIVRQASVAPAIAKCIGVFMPSAAQGVDGVVTVTLGAKGVVELELVADAEKWGRGPKKDIHSSNRARVDSPAWHLVQALGTLVNAEGDPAIEGYTDAVRGLSAAEKAMLDDAARRIDEATTKKSLGVDRWAHDANWRQCLEDLCAKPTVNIEGLVGGYTGPGGKTVLPHRAVAKMDLRLVPDMTRAGSVAKLKAHLAKHGFGDVEVNVTGGYDPNTTRADASLVRAQIAVYKRAGIEPVLWPRSGGSWPGYVFTEKPLGLAAGHFGFGHGLRAHAPDEYYLIDSADPKVFGWDRAVRSFVDYLYEVAKTPA